MRVVIDTNVVISALLSSTGIPAQILEAWRLDAFELVVSEPILAEYHKALSYEPVLARHRMSHEEIAEIVEGFREFAVLIEPNQKIEAIPDDPEDNKFLECALAGEAAYVVSGDAHLLALRHYQDIQILSPTAFLALLREEG